MRLNVYLSVQAEKFLAHLGKTNEKLYQLIKSHLLHLPEVYKGDPFLKGPDCRGVRRHRVGDYRILYRVIQERLIIYVIGIGHRRDVYDR